MAFVPSLLSLSAAFAAAPAQFTSVTVDPHVGIGYGLALSDVDGDHRVDILLVDKDVVAWYHNPGWEKHVLAEKLTAIDHVCIAARDVDGDGKCEVAVGAGWNPSDTVGSGSVHFLSAPADRTQRWQPVELPHEPTVHRMRWVKDGAGRLDLVVSPLHGRGNKNGEGAGIRLLLYRRPPAGKDPWTTELIDGDLHVTHNLEPINWDADPEDEILLAAKEGVFLLDRAGGAWKRIRLGGNGPGETAFQGASEVRTGRLEGGRRFIATVEPFHGNKVVIYTPPAEGAAADALWKRLEIDDSLAEGHAVAVGDILGAGSDQLLVGWRKKDAAGKVGIRLYVPSADGKTWSRAAFDDNEMACEDIALADLDGDGGLEVVAAGRDSHNLKVYSRARAAK